MDEITIKRISYIMPPFGLFVWLDTQDSMAPDMNEETTAFS